MTPHPGGGDTRMKAIKSDLIVTAMSKRKWSPGFSGKNRRVTPPVAAPGVTHPSDATATSEYWMLVAYRTRAFLQICGDGFSMRRYFHNPLACTTGKRPTAVAIKD